jgi:predicted RNA-binding protein YlqC (UPF0109 family)
MKNTEQDLLIATIECLMAEPINPTFVSATGAYEPATRRITLDFGKIDIGPIIGAGGSTKLAIQTLLACPFGGDSCHIQLMSTRETRKSIAGNTADLNGRIDRMMQALENHIKYGNNFRYRIERSDSAIIVLVETNGLFVEQLRGALAKLIRAAGRKHGSIAVLSIENHLYA